MKRAFALVALATLSLAFAGADSLFGNHRVRTEARQVAAFEGIDMRGVGKLVVTQGASCSVKVSLDSNLLASYSTVVRDRVLRLSFDGKDTIRDLSELRIEVTMPGLTGLFLDGACAAEIGKGFSSRSLVIGMSGAATLAGRLDVDSLDLTATGGVHLRLAGRSDALLAELGGACELAAEGLAAKSARLNLSGATRATLRVSDNLEVAATGAARFTYFGDPAVTVRQDGVARVTKG